jgi:DNA mismatch repair protein MLH3
LTLPPSISERCKLDPPVLISLLRSEVWRLASGDDGAAATRTDLDEITSFSKNGSEMHHWLRSLSNIPKPLLDILNSRACRSAIMFNDPLDKNQCKQLIRDLSRCAFPFICAHGRPSLVPLVELGQGEQRLGLVDQIHEPAAEASFRDAWTQWQG